MKNIIIVDMQNGFINQNNNFLVDRINDYLQKNTFDNIIVTKYINNEQSPFVKILNYTSLMTSKEQELAVHIPENNKITIFEKYGYGLTEQMINKLKDLGIEEIEICGTDSDACVMAIAYNLFDSGIKPIILKDMIGSSSKNTKLTDYSLQIMARSFGKDNII